MSLFFFACSYCTSGDTYVVLWGDKMAKTVQIVCTNIFQCADTDALKEEFTQKMIELINQLEKSKDISIPMR